jgi:dihydrofolate reductase
MRLTSITHVTLDGVAADSVFGRADAFLFGRRTYDIFAGYWGVMDPSENAIAEALNTKPKYVASSTLTEPEWDDTTVLSGDVAGAGAELKAKLGGELQVHGSGALLRSLMDHDLVDEINLSTYPLSSARARGCSPTRARTGRSNWPSRRSRRTG